MQLGSRGVLGFTQLEPQLLTTSWRHMTPAGKLFESALEWLRENYDEFLFRNENDIVTVLWARMVKVVKAQGLPFEVDYEQSFSVPSFGRRLQCDIVVFGANRKPLACIEVKFEPART